MSGSLRAVPRPRAADLWGLAFSAIRQQKVRATLTLIGVVVGTFALVLSLAVGRGVERAIVNLFRANDRLRLIAVYPGYHPDPAEMPADRREPKGAMSDAKRARIRQVLMQTWRSPNPRRFKLTPEVVRTFASMEHVEAAMPAISLGGRAILDGHAEGALAESIPTDTRTYAYRLIAGRPFRPDDGRAAIVDEYLLYRWGLTSDAEAESAVGKTFRMEVQSNARQTADPRNLLWMANREVSEKEGRALESALKRLAGLVRFLPFPADERAALEMLFEHISPTSTQHPAQTLTEEFRIVGVLREKQEGDPDGPINRNFNPMDNDILLPTPSAVAFALRLPETAENGFDSVFVRAGREEDVKGVEERIKGMGYATFSLAEFIGTVRLNVLMVSVATAFIAIVALIVAAIGITNTMIMSVLERTHEIGILKALGARDGHIRLIFVVEGVLMGLIGSGLGMLVGWLASFPGDSIARSIIEPQTRWPVKETLFAFPIWLVAGVPVLVCLITTVAALYPAHRAARVDPVTSLRHE